MFSSKPSEGGPDAAARPRSLRQRYWWVLPLLLLLVPTALILYFILATPEVQNFEYPVR